MGGVAETKALVLCHGCLPRSASLPAAAAADRCAALNCIAPLPLQKTASGVPHAVTDAPYLHITRAGSTDVTQPAWCRSVRWQSWQALLEPHQPPRSKAGPGLGCRETSHILRPLPLVLRGTGNTPESNTHRRGNRLLLPRWF